MKKLLAFILLMVFSAVTYAQVTVSVNPTTADITATPAVTWTVAGSPTSCTASGGWTGSRAVTGGTQTMPAINATTTYTLTCSYPGSPAIGGSAVVSWVPVMTNTDGTVLTDLAGFRVLYGTSATSLSQSQVVTTPSARSLVVNNLATGTWYFTVRAVNSAGLESANGNVASRAIVGTPAVPPFTRAASATVTIRPAPLPPAVTVDVVADARVNGVPVFRLVSTGVGKTPFGVLPAGTPCGAYAGTWRKLKFHRVVITSANAWGTTDYTNLVAPCGVAS